MAFLRSVRVNLLTFPSPGTALNGRIVLGDLHGNSLFLLWSLIHEQMVSLPHLSYDNAVEIYRDEPLTDAELFGSDDLVGFSEIVNDLKKVETTKKMLLLGDDLCDRGSNDLLTLMIYKRLDQINVKLPVIFSNHALGFLLQYASGFFRENLSGFDRTIGNSLEELQNSIKDGDISEKYVNELVEEYYLHRLKLLDYDLEGNGLTIYSHAPTHMRRLQKLAEFFQVEFLANTPNELAKTIDNINGAFQSILQNKNKQDILALCQNELIKSFVWSRYPDLQQELTQDSAINAGAFPIKNIHGHEPGQALNIPSELLGNWQYMSLDGLLGKTHRDPLPLCHYKTNTSGEYITYHHCDAVQLVNDVEKTGDVFVTKKTISETMTFWSRPEMQDIDYEKEEETIKFTLPDDEDSVFNNKL